MSTYSSNAQSVFSMTENENDEKAETKQKGLCGLSPWHTSSASFFENSSRHGDTWKCGSADRTF